MVENIKNYVIRELESYPWLLRQIAVLRYEMEHPVHVSAEEMLVLMEKTPLLQRIDRRTKRAIVPCH